MNIKGIQAIQVPRNAVSPVDRNNATAIGKNVSSAGKVNTGAIANESGTPQIQAARIGPSIGSIQAQLDLILVNYPPFFPIGKYQRLDLIKGVNHVQEEIEKSNIDPNLKKTYSGEKLSEKATDEEISVALEKLYQLRHAISSGHPSETGARPSGMILDLKG